MTLGLTLSLESTQALLSDCFRQAEASFQMTWGRRVSRGFAAGPWPITRVYSQAIWKQELKTYLQISDCFLRPPSHVIKDPPGMIVLPKKFISMKMIVVAMYWILMLINVPLKK